MQKISAQYVFLGIALVCLIAASMIPTFLYLRIRSAQKYVSQVQGDLSDEGFKETRERMAHQLVLKTADERARIATMSVSKDDAAGFIKEVEIAARSAGVALDIGQVTVGDTKGGLQKLQLQVTAEGSQAAIVNYLQLLETMPEAAAVTSAVLEKREKTWTLRADMLTLIHI